MKSLGAVSRTVKRWSESARRRAMCSGHRSKPAQCSYGTNWRFMRPRRISTRADRDRISSGSRSLARDAKPVAKDDQDIRVRVIDEMGKQPWAPRDLIDVSVRNGVVELWGVVTADHQREAAAVTAQNVAGVKKVINHIGRIEPIPEMAFPIR